ncbi:hypothetical protein CLAFUW4_08569 [Fulvia fulva]|uniref:Uncharacterized protein n=1 Tax=Passalora fulva TaxID=5499 RepID=A0A9Q8P6R5_PASFU|nr:uncharacterized protein CLAFUR5_08671 [Fulvia fulva]KAK4629232.1 hypothetical protein CLAFUR4_08572 [Fulvia fulva]KAK4630650.1 hypothetical protein CLAFUR0_08567 [Fulvia fulva]UJO15226.1 hypothetical protein CLAFUR5_08671 [Fulvia fulva]WPV12397.1 hypothetical protein CLAFUW4_08569 [Fulvia fulva]WPV27410.1 hypothetical protein CLAFUW7_08567 [Fulvia fulva]
MTFIPAHFITVHINIFAASTRNGPLTPQHRSCLFMLYEATAIDQINMDPRYSCTICTSRSALNSCAEYHEARSAIGHLEAHFGSNRLQLMPYRLLLAAKLLAAHESFEMPSLSSANYAGTTILNSPFQEKWHARKQEKKKEL